jgi:anti-repressor protein
MESNLSKVGETINASEYMTSREIAEVTCKEHKNVLAAIRLMEESWIKVTGLNFKLSEYTDSTGRKLPMYKLNKTECLYIATKFNDEARAKLVIRWEELERANRMGNFNVPKSFREALLLAAEQQEVIENQQKQIEEKNAKIEADKPKVLFSEAVSASSKSILVRELAKLITQNGYQIGEKQLYERLRKSGYLCSVGESRNQPTQTYMNIGLFEIKKRVIMDGDEAKVYNTTVVTPKGVHYFINKFLGKGMK